VPTRGGTLLKELLFNVAFERGWRAVETMEMVDVE
jgi:hypothetical protein